MKSTLQWYRVFFIIMMVTIAGCKSDSVPVPEENNLINTTTTQSFQLYILKADWRSLNAVSDKETFETSLRSVGLQESLVIIDASDIEAYDWSHQTLTLTEETTSKLRNISHELNPNIPNESLFGLSKHGFVVIFNGEWLYGGIFTEAGSAMRHSYPVIYFDLTEDHKQTMLKIRPTHSFQMYQNVDPLLKQTIEISEVHDYFADLGKIIE